MNMVTDKGCGWVGVPRGWGLRVGWLFEGIKGTICQYYFAGVVDYVCVFECV